MLDALLLRFNMRHCVFMAGEDNTVVELPNGSTKSLSAGEGSMDVNQSDRIQSNKPIQVDWITGDVWSCYEMRYVVHVACWKTALTLFHLQMVLAAFI